jgi:hypothetical protein
MVQEGSTMAQATRPLTFERETREFWKPQKPAFRAEYCHCCSNELVIGSRYCHLCGHERNKLHAAEQKPHLLDWHALARRTGLGSVSLLCAIFGVACLLAALATGLSASTYPWAAVETWRLEWLVATVAFFSAGCLFKKS